MVKRIAELVQAKTEARIISNNFSKMYNEGVAVVSQPPTRRIVELNMSDRDKCDASGDYNGDVLHYDGYEGNFFLSFPLMYFRVRYKQTQKRGLPNDLFVATQLNAIFADIRDKDKAFIPALPNIDDFMQVCISLSLNGFSEIDDLCKSVVSNFWSSSFNCDLYDAYEQYNMTSLLGDHRKWQEKTKNDPNWIPDGRNFKNFDDFNSDYFYGESFKKNNTIDFD